VGEQGVSQPVRFHDRLRASQDSLSAARLKQAIDFLFAGVREGTLAGLVVLIASLQITARSEDPNGTALADVLNVYDGTGGDLSQYRPLSSYLMIGLQRLLDLDFPPFAAVRFVQCLLIFGLAYMLYGQLHLKPRLRLIGVGLLAGIVSLELGRLGPSSFSLDRFFDAIFYLIAALLVLRGHETWTPAIIAVAIANRETAVFLPTLVLARHPISRRLLTDRSLRKSLLIALAAWAVAAAVYFAIHLYYGPRPRTEESYFGPAMLLRSLGMPGQTAFFFAAINVLPLLSIVVLKDADPFLQRLFWIVVPLWFAIHIWAARLGEGIMYLVPLALIIVPLVLQGLQRRLEQSASLLDGPPAPTLSA
jgi:hypothetical protein